MVEALIGRHRRGIDAVGGRDRRDEDVGAAELEVDARLALLHAADDLGAEHALEPLRGRLRIRAAQVDVIPGICRHLLPPNVSWQASEAAAYRIASPRAIAASIPVSRRDRLGPTGGLMRRSV